jgi:hypothetical protein
MVGMCLMIGCTVYWLVRGEPHPISLVVMAGGLMIWLVSSLQ